MLLEFCAQNLAYVEEAIEAGARRVELCDNLQVGGVSPSESVIDEAVRLAHGLDAAVMVMVRPRGGDFAYHASEIEAMERTIQTARSLGADGVVLGCVRNAALDEVTTRRLVTVAKGLDLTFHMAFDEILESAQPTTLTTLARLGFSRVLTHGGPLDVPIDKTMTHLLELKASARGRIGIMPGGGVTWQNVEEVCKRLDVSEAHGTRIVRLARERGGTG